MITKNYRIALLLFLLFALAPVACKDKSKRPNQPPVVEVPESNLELKLERFEQEIFASKEDLQPSQIAGFRKHYGQFFDLWCMRLAGIVPMSKALPSDSIVAFSLNQYRKDKYIRLVYDDSQKAFADVSALKAEMTDVFKRYQVVFPNKPVPELITYLSPFTSNVMAMDNILGCGLHFYLGQDYKYYPSLQLPQYMIRKFRKEYMVADLVRGWIDSEYANDSSYKDFLHQMVYEGKLLYAADILIPETPDTIKIGYSNEQLNWAYANESKIWAVFISEQLLYSGNPRNFMKFINDGQTTSGFPKEAPAKLGAFIGWQIVRSFMKQHPEIKVEDLFRLQDAQLILSQSSYKPSKPV